VVGNDDVIRPHIILPLVKSDDSRQHKARMYSDPHVNFHSGCLADVPVTTAQLMIIFIHHNHGSSKNK